MQKWKRSAKLLAGLLAVLYLGACLYFRTQQIQLIFKPREKIDTTPLRIGMEAEKVVIPVGSGADRGEVHGYWVPTKDDPDAPAILFLHGNDGNIGGRNLRRTQRLHEMGYQVLLIDYRGFGESFDTATPSEEKAYEDAEAAWNFLLSKGFKEERTFIYGHSLGGAIAIELASHHDNAAGLITHSTFTNMLDMSKLKYEGWLCILPMDLLLSQRFESLEKIGELKLPLLFIHGTGDEKIPDRMGKELYDAAVAPKDYLWIDKGTHSNSAWIGLVDYKKKVRDFIRKHS